MLRFLSHFLEVQQLGITVCFLVKGKRGTVVENLGFNGFNGDDRFLVFVVTNGRSHILPQHHRKWASTVPMWAWTKIETQGTSRFSSTWVYIPPNLESPILTKLSNYWPKHPRPRVFTHRSWPTEKRSPRSEISLENTADTSIIQLRGRPTHIQIGHIRHMDGQIDPSIMMRIPYPDMIC